MRSVLTVQTPATEAALTTLAAVKLDLGITDGTEDDYLDALIARASSAICAAMNVRSAGASRTIGRETLVETFYGPHTGDIVLSRLPAVSVSSVTDGGSALDASAYALDEGSGIIRRLDCQWGWRIHHHHTVAVTYAAGWLLTDDSSRDLPGNIEAAAILWIKAQRFARTRDPALAQERAEGIGSQYFDATGLASKATQAAIDALIAPYRIPSV